MKNAFGSSFVFLLRLLLLSIYIYLSKCALRKINDSISAWNVVPGFAGLGRFWDLEDLEPAFEHLGSMYHYKVLFEKLNSAKPITMVGVGSSLLVYSGGCYHKSLNALHELGIPLNPNVYPRTIIDPTTGKQFTEPAIQESACKSGRFMEGLLTTLNSSWPHRDHILVNLGKGGQGLGYFRSTCADDQLPPNPDIILLDTASNMATGVEAEALVRRYLALPSKPLIILLSNAKNCQAMSAPNLDPAQTFLACHRQCLYSMNDTSCDQFGPEPYITAGVHSYLNKLKSFQDIARRYGIPHINVMRVMNNSFISTDRNNTLGITKWQLLMQIYLDYVHLRTPNLDWQPCHPTNCTARGPLLFADLLVGLLYKAQTQLSHMPSAEKAKLSFKMPVSVFKETMKSQLSRCYGFSMQQLAHHAVADANEDDADASTSGLSGMNSSSKFFTELRHASKKRGGPVALPALNIIDMKGFTVQTYYQTPSGEMKWKPGWISDTPGATIDFEVDTSFPGVKNGNTSCVITFTESYDGWGQVKATCQSGCACKERVIDAASRRSDKVSLLKYALIPVSQSERCRIRLTVLHKTRSGGHKFKFSYVTSRIQFDSA